MLEDYPYIVHEDLKADLKRFKIITREVAARLHQPPSTVAGRLNGHLPLLPRQRKVIETMIIEKAAQLSRRGE